MIVEAAILDGEDRLRHLLRNGGQRHRPSLFALATAERRQHRRVERQPLAHPGAQLEPQHAIGRTRRWTPFRGFPGIPDIRDRRPLEDDTDHLAPELRGARHDGDRAGADRELAGLFRTRALRIPELVEAINQLPIRHSLSATQLQRSCEHPRKHRGALAVQTLVDQVREADVVIAGHETQDDHRDGERQSGQSHPAFPPRRPHLNSEPCDSRTGLRHVA